MRQATIDSAKGDEIRLAESRCARRLLHDQPHTAHRDRRPALTTSPPLGRSRDECSTGDNA